MQNKYPLSKNLQTYFFFQRIICEQQFCNFLTSNIDFFKNYNFSKILLVFSLFIELKNFFHKNCNEILINNYLNVFYQTLKLTHNFFHIDWIF